MLCCDCPFKRCAFLLGSLDVAEDEGLRNSVKEDSEGGSEVVSDGDHQGEIFDGDSFDGSGSIM
jgi:hypothetical protein